MAPDPAVLDELVRRVVDSVHPLRIILFGSAARGEMRVNSDLDTLIVVPDQRDCFAVNKILARKMRGLGYAVDIVVVHKATWNRTATTPISFCTQHSRKGRSSTVPPHSPAPATAREWLERIGASWRWPVSPYRPAVSGKTFAS